MNEFKEWSIDPINYWRVQRKIWTDDEQDEHINDSLVPPRYYVTCDKGITSKFAEPQKIYGKFSCNFQNGYCIHVTDEKGESVARIPLYREATEGERARGLPVEQALYVAKIITDALNDAQHKTIPEWQDCRKFEKSTPCDCEENNTRYFTRFKEGSKEAKYNNLCYIVDGDKHIEIGYKKGDKGKWHQYKHAKWSTFRTSCILGLNEIDNLPEELTILRVDN